MTMISLGLWVVALAAPAPGAPAGQASTTPAGPSSGSPAAPVPASPAAVPTSATPPASPPETALVDATTRVPDLQVDLKYSTPDNFLGRDVYGDLDRCLLQPDAADMLARAAAALRSRRPDLRLRAFDCARPHSVQVAMWALVAGTPQAPYVANPHGKTGSIHNYGCAVDLTLATEAGDPLDMGTPFDHFGPEAEPRREPEMVQAGRLTETQVVNRVLLREAMIAGGFVPLANEWWHFNCASPEETRRRFRRIP